MRGAWWVGSKELIPEQRDVIALPPEGSHLVLGPPGSGKTNLLVLRASFLARMHHLNILILTFNRTLKEFIASGAAHYKFPASRVKTYTAWQMSFLWEYGEEFRDANSDDDEGNEGDFGEVREARLRQIAELVEAQQITNAYSAILVDEAQDYTVAELQLFRRLAERLFLVADSRQQIYKGKATVAQMRTLVDSTSELRHHHRCGEQICRVADGLTKDKQTYPPLLDTCNYDEESAPSSVGVSRHPSLDDQMNSALQHIRIQLSAYPGDLIGILVPNKRFLDDVWNRLAATDLADISAVQKAGAYVAFETDKRIYICTIHSAKGCEFRCVHILMAEAMKKLPLQRNTAFTAVTRTRTALLVYHQEDIAPHFEEALECALHPDRKPPDVDDLFTGAL